jgi:hypothetical protein
VTTRARVAIALDVAIVLLVAATAYLWITGGFYAEPFGVRVSARQPDRAFLALVVVGLIRWRVGRGVGLLGRPEGLAQRVWRRLYHPEADHAVASPARWWHALAATVGISAAGAWLMRAQLRQMDGVGDFGDPLFSVWRMGWVFRQLGGDPRPLFDANTFHPTPLTLTLSDSMLLPSLTASPLLAAGMAPIVAYNVLLLSGFLLSGVAAYLLVRRVTGSPMAAFIGGLIYAFHPYRFEHYSHLELQMTQWMPLSLLFLHRFAESRRARDVVLAALCAVAQLYSSMYYGVFFVFFAAAVMGCLLVVTRATWRRLAGPAAIGAVIALVIAIPLARPYLAAQAMKGDRDTHIVMFYSADLSDYFRPHPRLAAYHDRLLPDVHPERALFPGATPLLLSAVALVPPLGPVRLAYGAGLVVALDMSHGMKGILYPILYEWFPPLRGMRVPARFAVILGISLVVLASFGARRLMARMRAANGRALMFAALSAAVLIDLRPAIELQSVWREPPPIYDTLAGRPNVVLAEFPFTLDAPYTSDLPYMYFSVWHGLPMVNGYSGFTPRDHEALVASVEDFPGPQAVAALRARGVTHVTINCALMPEGCPALLEAADRSADLGLLRDETWQGRPVRLYELSSRGSFFVRSSRGSFSDGPHGPEKEPRDDRTKKEPRDATDAEWRRP